MGEAGGTGRGCRDGTGGVRGFRLSHVASLATTRRSSTASTTPDSGGGSTTNPSTSGNATRLVDKWAACMRRHGDPGQADPTIDANRVIHVTLPAGYYGGLGLGGKAGTNACAVYMNRVIDAFQSGLRFPDHAQVLAFSKCMRTNGVPDFPDPIGGNLAFNIASGGDLNPTNPHVPERHSAVRQEDRRGVQQHPSPGRDCAQRRPTRCPWLSSLSGELGPPQPSRAHSSGTRWLRGWPRRPPASGTTALLRRRAGTAANARTALTAQPGWHIE